MNYKPTNLGEIVEAVCASSSLFVRGTGSKRGFLNRWDGLDLSDGADGADGASRMDQLDLSGLTGIVEFAPEDNVVVAWAGTTVAELQGALAERGQCLPLPPSEAFGTLLAGVPGTLGGLLSMNLPHGLWAQFGGPRDWTLGLQVVRADGTVAKCGSKTVKNVAGYNAQRLFVGARGTLGVIARVTLRTYAKVTISPPCKRLRAWDGGPMRVVRCLPTDFEALRAAAGERLLAEDPASYTAWLTGGEPVAVAGEHWSIAVGHGAGNWRIDGPEREFVRRAKGLFDPGGKLNRGELQAALA